MSYILDALQRAEQERQRKSGIVPGLQTQTLPAPLDTGGGNQILVGRWGVFALILVSAGIAATLALWRTPSAVTTSTITNAPVVAAPLAEPASVHTVATVATPLPQPVAPATKPSEQAKTLAIIPISTASRPASAPVTSLAPVSVTPTPVALPLLKDMSEDFRRQVPPLVISGVVYSENPAQRLLLVNGQVLSQGSRAAADLTLDEIQPTASSFTFRGTRFKLHH